MTTVRAARARNGARNCGFSRTRSNTAVGSNRTRTRSRTAPITTSRTKGSPSRTAGTAPNIRESMVAARRLAPGPKLDGELDQHRNDPSPEHSVAEARSQDGVHRGLIEPRMGTLDHLDRGRLGATGRIDDGAHDDRPLNPCLAQQVGILKWRS